MARDTQIAEVFIEAFKGLKKNQKDAVFEKMLEIKEYREDLIDLAIIEARKKEPRISLRGYLAKRQKKTA